MQGTICSSAEKSTDCPCNDRHLIIINHHLTNSFSRLPAILTVGCSLSHSKDDIERFHRKQFWPIIAPGYLLFNPTIFAVSNITSYPKIHEIHQVCSYIFRTLSIMNMCSTAFLGNPCFLIIGDSRHDILPLNIANKQVKPAKSRHETPNKKNN